MPMLRPHPFFALAVLLALALAAPGTPAIAQGLGQNFGGLQVSGDQPISIESDQLDVDDSQAIATFTGNVDVSQGDTELRTGRLVVHYARDEATEGEDPASDGMPGGSGQIERLEASENVYIKSAEQVATADRANFDMESQVVVMTGNVVLTQGQNVVEGCRLTIQMETGVARLESQNCQGAEGGGRVRMMLTPGEEAAN